MIINKEKLLELLVEKSGLPREEVKDQLDELVQNIREAAERDKDFQIDVFGTFSVNKDGSLTFSPSEKLETEINHRYAGMKPIEIIGAFENTPGVDVEESEENAGEQGEAGQTEEEDFTTSFVYDEPEDEEDSSEQDEEETVFETAGQKISADRSDVGSEEDTEKAAEAETDEEAVDEDKSLKESEKEKQEERKESVDEDKNDPFGLKEALESGKKPESSPSESKAEEQFIPPGPKKEPMRNREMEEKERSESPEGKVRPAPSMTPLKVSTASKKSAGKTETSKNKTAAKKKQSKTSESDPIGRVLIAAVIVIAIGVSGWLTYDLFLSGNGNGSEVTGTSAPVQAELSGTAGTAAEQGEPAGAGTDDADSEDTQEEEGSALIDAENTEQEGSQAIEDNESGSVSNIAEQSRQSMYRLRGGAVPKAEQGYTIVVHSLRNEEKARSLGQQLETDGYITVISRATVNGLVFWRVGLGQFRSMEDAQEAVEQLPERYRNNHFIRSIQ